MALEIPRDYEDIIRQAVARGSFENTDAALRHALELFAQAVGEQAKLEQWNLRNQAAIDQSRQRQSKSLDEQAVIDRLHVRLRAQETRH